MGTYDKDFSLFPGFGGIVLSIKEQGKLICTPILFYTDKDLKELRTTIDEYFGDRN